MAVQLTATAITKALKDAAETKKRLEVIDAGCRGLRLRVTPAGSTSWVLACRDRTGRMRRFELGDYGDKKGQLGIASARDACRTLHVKVKKEGADPVAEKRRDRAIGTDAKAGIGTLTALLDSYEAARGTKLKTWAEYRARIDSVFAKELPKALATLTRADLQATADRWPSQHSAGAAVRYLRPIIRWAADRQPALADLANVVPPSAIQTRKRVLSEAELGKLLPALVASTTPQAACFRFLLMTLARRDEAAGARWQDVDLKAATWLITDTKNKEPHIVPLPRQAVALLQIRLPKDKDGKARKPAPEALIFATGTGGALSNWDRASKAIMETSKTKGWTRHDLRRSGATLLGEMGVEPHVIEAALNHVSIKSPIAAVYNRSRYRPQVAEALQRLADKLDQIVAEAEARQKATATRADASNEAVQP